MSSAAASGSTSWISRTSATPPGGTRPRTRWPRSNSPTCSPAAEASLGVSADGGAVALPAFDSLNQQRSYIDVFNKGREPFNFTATASAPWITLSQPTGRVEDEVRVWVSVDWAKAPVGVTRGSVKIAGAGREETIDVTARKPSDLTRDTLNGFVESAGYVSMNASHFTSKTDVGPAGFRLVEQYGMRTDAPVDVAGTHRQAAHRLPDVSVSRQARQRPN